MLSWYILGNNLNGRWLREQFFLERKLFKIPFSLAQTPDWVCPTCTKGVLHIKKDTFLKEERKISRDHDHDAWEPDWISYVFSCFFVCSNDRCKEIVACSGVGCVEADYVYDFEGEQQQDWNDLFTPKYFEPHLNLLNISKNCPESVVNSLNDAFRLFFSSPSAASNCVRKALEELLTELKVKRFSVGKGKRHFIGLHERISMLPPKLERFKEPLEGIKWLGNAGSHGKVSITKDDVMDSLELMDQVLNDIYVSTAKELAGLAKRVNRKKGPVKKVAVKKRKYIT